MVKHRFIKLCDLLLEGHEIKLFTRVIIPLFCFFFRIYFNFGVVFQFQLLKIRRFCCLSVFSGADNCVLTFMCMDRCVSHTRTNPNIDKLLGIPIIIQKKHRPSNGLYTVLAHGLFFPSLLFSNYRV